MTRVGRHVTYHKCPIRRPRPNKRPPPLFPASPTLLEHSESFNTMFFRLYFRVTSSFLCIVYGNSTQNISLEFYLFPKQSKCQRWHSESSNKDVFLESIPESPSGFYAYFMTIVLIISL